MNGLDVVGGASVRALRTKLHDNRRAGALVDYAGLQLDNVEAFNNAWVGLAIRHLSKATLRFCRCYANELMGIWMVEKSETTAESCDAHDNGASGIQAIGVADTILRGCSAYANKENGIHTWDAKVTLESCECYSNGQAGIWLQGETPIARSCSVHENHGHGIRITDGGIATVEDCEVAANSRIGITLETECHPTIRRSRLHDNKADGATEVGTSTTGLFVDCDVYGNAESGIGILGGSLVVRSCHFTNNKNGLVAGGGRATAEDCIANGNVRAGVAILPGGTLSALRCTASGNKICGLFVENDATAIFERCEATGNGPPNSMVRPRGKVTFLDCRID